MITDFITARLDEEQVLAEAATPNPSRWTNDYEDAAHIAAQAPARTLRRVASLRAIVDAHPNSGGECGACMVERETWMVEPETSEDYIERSWDASTFPCPTLRALALAWADHPDYNPEWSLT